MKFSILSLVSVAAVVVAQLDAVPKCAVPCVAKFTGGSEIAGCKQLDVECICKNDSFINDIACCLSTACDQAGQMAAVTYAKQICSSQGVVTPDQVTCNNSNSTSSATSAAGSKSSAPATPTAKNVSAPSTASAGATATGGAAGAYGAGGVVGALALLLAL